MKKALSLALAAAMAASLAACGGSPAASTASSAATTDTAASGAASAGGQTLKVMLSEEPGEGDAFATTLNKWADETGNTVDIMVIPYDDQLTKFPLMAKNNDLPDLLSTTRLARLYPDEFEDLGKCIDTSIFEPQALLLQVNGKLYLNEVNWRNSGTIYSVLGSKVYYPVNWYYWKTKNQSPENFIQSCLDETVYTIDESLDLRHVACGNITLKQWLRDKKKSKAFALWYTPDMRPAIAQYLHLLKELIKRHGV